MVDIHARWIVAFMENVHPVRDRTSNRRPYKSMGEKALRFAALNESVTSLEFVSLDRDASILVMIGAIK